MSTPPSSSAPRHGRRPFGMVNLAAPVAAVPAARRAPGPGRPARWFGPRVTLPPLSVDALRRTDRADDGRART